MILSSCDSYEDAWYPFCHQLVTYWPEFDMPIYLGTESKTFKYEGLNIMNPLSGGKIYRQWSERLLQLLKRIDSEFVLFMLDDFWLTEKVDDSEFKRIFSYMEKDKSIGYICLKQEVKDYSSATDKANAVDCEYPELWECKANKSYRITTQVGLWRKKYLIKLLRSHESAWFFETRATWRSKFYRERVFDVKKTVLTYPIGGFFGGGKCYSDYIDLYPKEILEVPLKRGTIQFGATRTYPKDVKGIMYYWNLLKSISPKW